MSSASACLERGLGANPTKMGPGDKEKGLAFRGSTLRRVMIGLLFCGVLLLTISATYAVLYSVERKAGLQERTKGRSASVQAVRMGASLQAALHEQNADQDAVRLIKRVNSVVEEKFEDMMQKAAATIDYDQLSGLMLDTKREVLEYISSEMDDYTRERDAAAGKNKEMIEKITRMQKQSLRSILNTVSDSNSGAMEDMLTDLFESVNTTPSIDLPDKMVEDLDDLVDLLFQNSISFDEGWEKLHSLEQKYDVTVQLVGDHAKVVDTETMANEFDMISEAAKVSKGRTALKELEEEWNRISSDGSVTVMQPGDADPTVELMLKVQDLVNVGHVPAAWLDFEDIEIEPPYEEESPNDGNKS